MGCVDCKDCRDCKGVVEQTGTRSAVMEESKA